MANKQIGALWAKTYTKDGEEKRMLSGVLDLGVMGEVHIAIFKNDRKEKDTHPDYRIVLSERREQVPEERTEEVPF